MKRKKIRDVSTNFPSIEIDETSVFRPLSYYLLGGVDLQGDKLKTDTPIAYDSETAIEEMEKQGEVEAIGVCDPRVDMFDVVIKAKSVEKGAKAIADAKDSIQPSATES